MTAPPPTPAPHIVRRTGWFLFLVGLALVVGMAVITWQMAAVVNAPNVPGRGTRWTGDHALTVQMFGMFGAVILFGAVTALNGAWTIRRGAFNPVLRVVSLLIGAALVVDAVVFVLTHGDG